MKRHNFKELLIWQLAMDIVDDVYQNTSQFPKEEQFGLKQQLRKTVISPPSNIAEGCGRGTNAQLIQFLNIAQGSSCELETQVYIAIRQHFGDSADWQKTLVKIKDLQKMIDGFVDRFT